MQRRRHDTATPVLIHPSVPPSVRPSVRCSVFSVSFYWWYPLHITIHDQCCSLSRDGYWITWLLTPHDITVYMQAPRLHRSVVTLATATCRRQRRRQAAAASCASTSNRWTRWSSGDSRPFSTVVPASSRRRGTAAACRKNHQISTGSRTEQGSSMTHAGVEKSYTSIY